MILAEKIMNERKKNGWSQEDLAERLDVSRQSVSKWESAQAIPDLGRIVEMAKLFGVTTDYLLKDDEAQAEDTHAYTETMEEGNCQTVSFEEAGRIVALKEKNAPEIANAVSLCIISPALLIFLAGLSDSSSIISEAAACGIGVIAMLLLIAFAVSVFIRKNIEESEYEHLEKEAFDTAYGVDSMVQEKRREFAPKRTNSLTLGVTLCILSVVPLLVAAFLEAPDYIVTSAVSVLLLIVAFAVNLIVRSEIIWGTYNVLLQKGEYTKENKANAKLDSPISSIYWTIVLVAFLATSFLTNRWDRTWIIWAVAGILYPAVKAFVDLLRRK